MVQRIQEHIRARFKIPAFVSIEVGPAMPSDIPGFKAILVTLAHGGKTYPHHFFISDDGTKLAQLNTMDISENPFSVSGRPTRGAADAKVKLIVYDDFECPYCARNYKTLFGTLMPLYKDKILVVYKDFPLYQIHPWAIHAAVDANCLFSQSNDAYWDFADYVHDNQGEITGSNRPLEGQFKALDDSAVNVGQKDHLDGTKLQACIQAQDDSAVLASEKFGSDTLNIDATPTLFLNGDRMDGAIPADVLRDKLDKALEAAGVTPPAAPAAPPAASEQKAPAAASPTTSAGKPAASATPTADPKK